jgi:hypothetical protein
MNLLISTDKGVGADSAEDARFAIYPITVESPVLKHIPLPLPLVQVVPKNATFFDSNIFSEGSIPGSNKISPDSPVKEELFTFKSSLLNMIKSQGILFPDEIITISPGTINFALIFYSYPSLKTKAYEGI